MTYIAETSRVTIPVVVVFSMFYLKMKTNMGLRITDVLALTSIEITVIAAPFRVETKSPSLSANRMKMALTRQTATKLAVQVTAVLSVLKVQRTGCPIDRSIVARARVTMMRNVASALRTCLVPPKPL